jgi:hypothetical protein
MNTNGKDEIEARMAQRAERTVLHLKKSLGRTRFRYVLAERHSDEYGLTYSIYAEYRDEKKKTVGSIPDFSPIRETAEAFCRLLARTLATPLSLEAIYEDSYTP